MAKVVPIYKGDCKNLISNYRPVSVLPVFFSKILERLLYNRLLAFLNKHNLLYKYQFGFREKLSTDTALIILIDKITSALNDGDTVLGVFLDFSKAFDCVNHSILLQKLEHLGIRGVALEWFRSYLNKREQYVCYNGTVSSKTEVTCGVPQGSILGPLLFLIYINYIANVSTVLFLIIFADDTNAFISGKNTAELIRQMNEELEKLVIWLEVNKLKLNIKKTHFIIFSTTKQTITEQLCIKQVDNTKFLGVNY